jgi:FkbM family methyltransferase
MNGPNPRRDAAPLWLRIIAQVIRQLPAGRYRLLPYAQKSYDSCFRATLPSALGGWSFVCDLRDCISSEVFFTGKYEPQESLLVRNMLRPGMTFVDVGANWGYFTLIAAGNVGPNGRVISLEPDPRLFALLQENTRINGFTQASAVPVAAAAISGQLTLAGYRDDGHNWGISHLLQQGSSAAGPLFQAEARPIDELMDAMGVTQVDLIKIDIEGAEKLALEGMKDGLRSRRYRRILLELHPEALRERGHDPVTPLELFREANYRIWKVDHSLHASRRAAYSRYSRSNDYLSSYTAADSLDSWPHMLCLAPGVSL